MDLKELLGENYKEDITVEEISNLISAMKLADLSKGEYVAKGKLTEAENKLTNLKKEYGEYKASKEAYAPGGLGLCKPGPPSLQDPA